MPNRDDIIATQAVQGRGYPGSSETGIIQVEYAKNLSILHCDISKSGNHGIPEKCRQNKGATRWECSDAFRL